MKIAGFFDPAVRAMGTAPGRISIARYAPRGFPKGWRGYTKLAPGPWFNKVSRTEYLKRYRREVLGVLDAQEVWADLHAIASGAEPVLLCWEHTPVDMEANFCHRLLVAEWFKEQLGVDVEQLGEPVCSCTKEALDTAGSFRFERDDACPVHLHDDDPLWVDSAGFRAKGAT